MRQIVFNNLYNVVNYYMIFILHTKNSRNMISTIFGMWTLWYEDMHNCTSLKSLMFKKQLTLLAMRLTQPWHLFKG